MPAPITLRVIDFASPRASSFGPAPPHAWTLQSWREPMTQESKIYGDLAERYIAAWNETNADRRRDLITKTWTETATYVDPLMKGEGQQGTDAMAAAVQERFPAHRYAVTGRGDGFRATRRLP